MSERELFEQRFPVPLGVKWCARQRDYTYENYRALDSAASYSGKWQAWQAARSNGTTVPMTRIAERKLEQLGGDVCGVLVRKDEKLAAVDEHGRVQWLQCGQGVEPVAWRVPSVMSSNGWNFTTLLDRKKNWETVSENVEALYTQPQPAQQESVPEGWKLVPVEPTTEMRCAYHEAYQRYLEGSIPSPDGQWWAMLDATPTTPQLAAPQPEGDGWIKCSDRLPKLGQRVQLFSQGVIQHMMPLFDDSDEGLFWDFEVHDYNPPVDMSRDQWRPLPQPPKEGEGDE